MNRCIIATQYHNSMLYQPHITTRQKYCNLTNDLIQIPHSLVLPNTFQTVKQRFLAQPPTDSPPSRWQVTSCLHFIWWLKFQISASWQMYVILQSMLSLPSRWGWDNMVELGVCLQPVCLLRPVLSVVMLQCPALSAELQKQGACVSVCVVEWHALRTTGMKTNQQRWGRQMSPFVLLYPFISLWMWAYSVHGGGGQEWWWGGWVSPGLSLSPGLGVRGM